MRTLFEEFLVMPLPILWLLLLALLLWRRQRASRTLFAAATVLFVLASLPAVGKLLIWGLASGAPLLQAGDGRELAAVVAPTAGTFDDGTGRWWAGKGSIQRVTAARELQKRLGIPLVVAGGSPLPGQPPEAATVAAELRLSGPGLLLETTARDTGETGAAVAALLVDRPVHRVLVVTNASHIARMSAAFRHHGFDVVAAPVGRPPSAFAPGALEAVAR